MRVRGQDSLPELSLKTIRRENFRQLERIIRPWQAHTRQLGTASRFSNRLGRPTKIKLCLLQLGWHSNPKVTERLFGVVVQGTLPVRVIA